MREFLTIAMPVLLAVIGLFYGLRFYKSRRQSGVSNTNVNIEKSKAINVSGRDTKIHK